MSNCICMHVRLHICVHNICTAVFNERGEYCIHTCEYYMCIYIYRHIHIHTLHTHTYTAFEIRLYVRMYACMSAHVFNYTGIHMYSGLHMHAYIRECMYQSVGVRATMHSIAQNRKRSFQSADPTLIFRVT